MKNKILVLPPKSLSRSFTLIELIVVIIIVGILAAVGMTQYSKVVEKGRQAEAKTNLGLMRQLAYEYRLEKGTISGITNSDLNVGTDPNQIPSVCRDTHYFYYGIRGSCPQVDPVIEIKGWRCTSGGKPPQFSDPTGCEGVALKVNLVTGATNWQWSTATNCDCTP
jgi:prepilin-type N-terminal cleavage/methylation domain-containing protein